MGPDAVSAVPGVTRADVTLDNIEFSGARVADHNGGFCRVTDPTDDEIRAVYLYLKSVPPREFGAR